MVSKEKAGEQEKTEIKELESFQLWNGSARIKRGNWGLFLEISKRDAEGNWTNMQLKGKMEIGNLVEAAQKYLAILAAEPPAKP